MNLARKASSEKGYAMAALLVALAVMAIVMGAAMPTWSQMIRREKEEELIFRGNQYARAINQYQRKFANASPASLDVLIEQRLLRKKFKDPLSPNKDGEFQLLYLQSQGTTPGASTGASTSTGTGANRGTGASAGTAARGAGQSPTTGGGSIGPSPTGRGTVVGVTSKNTGQSIRIYKGKNRYNEWQFLGMDMNTQAGPPAGAGGRGPQRGTQRGATPPGRDGSGRQGSGSMNAPRTPPSRQGQ